MQERWDEDLTRLFDEARQPLPAEEFAERVAFRVRRVQRWRTRRRLVSWLLAAACAFAVSPYVLQGSFALAACMDRWLPSLGGALLSPAGWVFPILFALWLLRRVGMLGR